jgi:4-amino-4-deoxy-L-arabinose transferase-like glycosyltransferase
VTARSWRWALGGAVALGLAIRLVAVLARPHITPNGDPFIYWRLSNLLVEGKGWIDPYRYVFNHQRVQTAFLPPLYTLIQALCSLVGFKSFFAHRIWSAIVSTSTVGLAAAVGKEVSGRRVGLIAAFGAAIYPNLWMSPSIGMSETVSPALVLVVVWAAYRMLKAPSAMRAAALGAALALAALARDELILLAPFLLVPLAAGVGRARGAGLRSMRDGGRLLLSGVAALSVVLAPWVGFNVSRFHQPVFITDRFGLALAASNCDQTWHGRLAGYWSFECAGASLARTHGNEAARDSTSLNEALDFIGPRVGSLPLVEAERLGRTFGLFRPIQQIQLDIAVEGRPAPWPYVGLWMYYALAILAIPGGLVLRRRGVSLVPMVAVAAEVVVATLLTYGQTRFRAPLEPVLVILAAVAADELISRRGRAVGRRRPERSESRPQHDPTSVAEPAL